MAGIDFDTLYSEAVGTGPGDDAASVGQDQGVTLDALLAEVEAQRETPSQEGSGAAPITQEVDQVSADLAMYGLGGMEGPAPDEKKPVTAADWAEYEYRRLPWIERVKATTRGIMQSMAYGDNLAANLVKTVRNAVTGPAEGETPEQFATRVQVEEELLRAQVASLPGSTVGNVMGDVAIVAPAAMSVPFTLPAEAAVGAASGLGAYLASQSAAMEEIDPAEAGKQTLLGGGFGVAGYGVFRIGASILAKAAAKTGADLDEVVEQTILALPAPPKVQEVPLKPQGVRVVEEAVPQQQVLALPAPDSIKVAPEPRRVPSPLTTPKELTPEMQLPRSAAEKAADVVYTEVKRAKAKIAKKAKGQAPKTLKQRQVKRAIDRAWKSLSKTGDPAVMAAMQSKTQLSALKQHMTNLVENVYNATPEEAARLATLRAYDRARGRVDIIGAVDSGVTVKMTPEELAARQAAAREVQARVAASAEREATTQAVGKTALVGKPVRSSRTDAIHRKKLADNLFREVQKEATAYGKEVEKLTRAGASPEFAMEQAAIRRGYNRPIDDTASVQSVERAAARAVRRIRDKQLNQARYLEKRATRRNVLRRSVDEWFGQVSQRLEMISAPIGNMVKRMDAEVSVLRGFANQQANRMVRAIKGAKLSRRERRKFNTEMLNGPDRGLAYLRNIGKDTQELRAAIEAGSQFLEELGDTALAGSNIKKLPKGKFWPRRAKAGEYGSKGTRDEEILELLGITKKVRKSGSVMERQVDEVTSTNVNDYLDFTESWKIAANELIHSNATRRFLGRGYGETLAPYGVTKKLAIQRFVTDAWKRGELLEGNLEEAARLLEARMIDFETPSTAATSVIQSVTRMAFLANPKTALAQLTDAANLLGVYGPRMFLKGIFSRLPKQLRANETGMIHNALQEAGIHNGSSGARMVAQLSDWALKAGGMTGLDKIMTNRGMSVARQALLRKLKNPVKRAELKQELTGWASPEELDRIFDDVSKDKLNFDTLALYVAEYSKVKPVLTSQKSQAFGKADEEQVGFYRLMGTIKSFMTHQLGIVRGQILNEWKFGSKTKATKKFLGLGTAWVLAGGTIEQLEAAIFGGEPELSDSMLSGLLAMTGMSPFVLRNAVTDPDMLMQSLWLPAPLSAISRVQKDFVKAVKEEGDYTWMRNVPVLNWIYYATQGRDRKEVQAEMEAMKEENQSLQNPRIEDMTWAEAREYRAEQRRRRLERIGY